MACFDLLDMQLFQCLLDQTQPAPQDQHTHCGIDCDIEEIPHTQVCLGPAVARSTCYITDGQVEEMNHACSCKLFADIECPMCIIRVGNNSGGWEALVQDDVTILSLVSGVFLWIVYKTASLAQSLLVSIEPE